MRQDFNNNIREFFFSFFFYFFFLLDANISLKYYLYFQRLVITFILANDYAFRFTDL